MKFISKVFLSIIVVAVMALSVANTAMAAGKLFKVGVINLQYIMDNSKFAKQVQDKLNAKGLELKKNIQSERNRYEALKKEIELKKSVWSQEILEGKFRELQKIEEMGKIVSRDANYELQTLEKKLMGPILNELGELINGYGKREGYSIILDNTGQGSRSGILYFADSLDISKNILAELDRNLAKKKR